jgi:hypothetical protein
VATKLEAAAVPDNVAVDEQPDNATLTNASVVTASLKLMTKLQADG